jgi:hypothetical protein
MTMTGKIKTTTAFRALTARRAAETNATKTHMAKSVNKDGTVSRMAPTGSDWQLNAFTTAEAAETRRAELERLNPGKRYIVVAI